MNNYEFCAAWAAQQNPSRVLDYGCGAGQIVGLLIDRGVDAYGCDVFYEGGSYASQIPERLQPRIRRMSDAIPFPDAYFDCVISNQVLEHVPDLNGVLREIARVLRPGGVSVNLFPDRGVWREGHCGIPFLHRLPRGRTRAAYAALLRSLGLGYHKRGKSIAQWSREFCDWLDSWTYYRPLPEIHRAFERHFASTEHAEEQWLAARVNRNLPIPIALQRAIVRRMAGIMLVSVKPQTHTQVAGCRSART